MGANTGKKRQLLSSTMLLILIAGCVLLSAIVISGLGGLAAGQKERNVLATQTTIADLDVQYQLGVMDLNEQRYELAAQRFRWIIARESGYPGVAEQLAAAEELISNPSAGIAAATLPPGSDDPAALFDEATTYYNEQQWENAITRLEEIQLIDPAFREVDVKTMLYEALQALGLVYIRGDKIEQGVLLLEQAAAIQPLDDQTEGEIYLATLYLTGGTYWQLDWSIAIANYEAIYELAPNYRDVQDRLIQAYTAYGEALLAGGDGCTAQPQFERANEILPSDTLNNKIDAAVDACANPGSIPSTQATSAPGSTPASGDTTPTPYIGIPTPRPRNTPTPEGE